MGYTSYKTKTNKTKTQHRKQRVNQELTVQRNWIHEIHKLQETNKTKNTTQSINTEKLATWDTDEDKQNNNTTFNLVLTVERNWLQRNWRVHEIHKLQDEDKQNKNTTQKTESQPSIDNTEKLAT